MVNIDKIIKEEINRALIEESAFNDIKKMFGDFFSKKRNRNSSSSEKHEKTKEELEKEKEEKKKLEKEKKGDTRTRKKPKGGREVYNLKSYRSGSGRILPDADASSIRNQIDMENTDIAAVARKVFRDHTEEGAQSHLRKILNGERPMTVRVGNKLMKMISRGKIAVK